MELPQRHLDEATLYNVIARQAEGTDDEASWLKGFELRDINTDPWRLRPFDPNRVYYEKPAELAAQVDDLRETIFEVVRPFFIENPAWNGLKNNFRSIYNDQGLMEFRESRNANLIVGLEHSQFFDPAEAAAASLDVRRELDPDNPFYDAKDPAANQIIIANRAIAVLDHAVFKELTGGLPIMEGVMLPLADVLTTISANGSGRLARTLLGPHLKPLTGRTEATATTKMTQGGKIIFVALSGNPAHPIQLSDESTVRQVDWPSKQSVNLVTRHNQGPAAMHKNALVGLSIDSPPIDLGRTPQTGVVATPEIFVPHTHKQVQWFMRYLVELSNGALRADTEPAFHIGPNDKPEFSLSQRERGHLAKTALSNYREK